jgi:UDP-glucose 4-epimerase
LKKVLVTGGAGYIGAHTAVELVGAGYLPVIVDNFCASERQMVQRIRSLAGVSVPLHELDCRHARALARVFEVEGPIFGVIHFAAHKSVGVSVRRPREYYANNLGSLTTLLEVMDAKRVERLVFSSSCTVYGQPESLPVSEQTPLRRPESPYGRTKQMCEAIIDDVARSRSELPTDRAAPETALRAVTLRYFNPIGAHPSGRMGELPLGKPETLVPYITQSAAGLRGELTVFGADYPTRDGTPVRDYIHVMDLAAAHVAALAWLERDPRRSFNEVFNVGTGKGTTVLELIAAFEAAAGKPLAHRIGPRRAGDAAEVYASVDKATRELDWRARLGILDAMRDAWRWQQTLSGKT